MENNNQRMFNAIEAGDLDTVRDLIDTGKINVNLKDEKGDTLLHLAVEAENKDIVKFLLSKEDIDINIKNNKNHTAFWEAAMIDNLKIINMISEHKDFKTENINEKDEKKQPLIYNLARFGRSKMVEFLLKKFKDKLDLSYIDSDGNSLLHVFCFKKSIFHDPTITNLDIIKALYDNFPDFVESNLNKKNKLGYIPPDFRFKDPNKNIPQHFINSTDYNTIDYIIEKFSGKLQYINIKSEENKLELLKRICVVGDTEDFSNLYKKDYLGYKFNSHTAINLLECICIDGNKNRDILDTLLKDIDDSIDIKDEDIEKFMRNICKNERFNEELINNVFSRCEKIKKYIEDKKVDNCIEIKNINKDKQGYFQVDVNRKFIFDKDNNLVLIKDEAYNKYNKEKRKIYEVNHNNGAKNITYFDEEGKVLTTAEIDINGIIRFDNFKTKKLDEFLGITNKILNDFKNNNDFDFILSYLAYAPIQLQQKNKGKNNIIFNTNCRDLDSLVNYINNSLNNENKNKMFVCDLGFDGHDTQIIISNGKVNMVNTDFIDDNSRIKTILKGIKRKFKNKFPERAGKIKISEDTSIQQGGLNCVVASKLKLRNNIIQFRKDNTEIVNGKKRYKCKTNRLVKQSIRKYKIKKKILDNKKTDKKKLQYLKTLKKEDFDIFKSDLKSSYELIKENESNFSGISERLKDFFKESHCILNKDNKNLNEDKEFEEDFEDKLRENKHYSEILDDIILKIDGNILIQPKEPYTIPC